LGIGSFVQILFVDTVEIAPGEWDDETEHQGSRIDDLISRWIFSTLRDNARKTSTSINVAPNGKQQPKSTP
jgi:hypothetical protein